MNSVFKWLSGRTTTFLCGFFVIGNAAFFLHRLDAIFISFMATFMGLVIGHSIKEDVAKAKAKPDFIVTSNKVIMPESGGSIEVGGQ